MLNRVPVSAKRLREVIHKIEKNYLHIAAAVVGVLDELRLRTVTSKHKRSWRKNFVYAICRTTMFLIVFRHTKNVGKRVRGVLRRGRLRKKFRRIKNNAVRIL